MRSLTTRFDSKVSSIKELKDLDDLSTDELHRILTTYEMRIEYDNTSKGEETFKSSKKKTFKTKDNSYYFSKDDEEAHYTKKLH